MVCVCMHVVVSYVCLRMVCVCMHVVSSYACLYMVCKHKLLSGLFSNECMGGREKVVLGSNGGATSAGSQLCRVESTTSKWL